MRVTAVVLEASASERPSRRMRREPASMSVPEGPRPLPVAERRVEAVPLSAESADGLAVRQGATTHSVVGA